MQLECAFEIKQETSLSLRRLRDSFRRKYSAVSSGVPFDFSSLLFASVVRAILSPCLSEEQIAGTVSQNKYVFAVFYALDLIVYISETNK
jgi:hypothetical protein